MRNLSLDRKMGGVPIGYSCARPAGEDPQSCEKTGKEKDRGRWVVLSTNRCGPNGGEHRKKKERGGRENVSFSMEVSAGPSQREKLAVKKTNNKKNVIRGKERYRVGRKRIKET